ncbi:CoA ester lyase [Verticiella sediminum]|uniref:CoA ester lyase n=1 Tax=Verticiella sediminum TaxID=1247510 RepID=A0A556AV18_9BURK|nr:CoA ester lyase [Verticiella sediminum]TSH96792.1 CoA ester lyase [Verticiella sediminum]
MNASLLRSILFVPADSERKIEKSATSGADAVVLDLEDSISPERVAYARGLAAGYLQANPHRTTQQLWIRVNALDSALILDDLAAVVRAAPDALMLPKCASGDDVRVLDHYLTALERREGLPSGRIAIVPVATETARAMFGLGSYVDCSSRLLGLTWGAEDLSATLGASANKDADGGLSLPYRLARSLCLFGAKAAGVRAIDGISPDFRDMDALKSDVAQARRDGFNAKFAIHPVQVSAINEGFSPEPAEIRRAQAIVDAFEQQQGRGAVQLDGVMLDKPHLRQALHLLAMAKRADAGRAHLENP